MSTKYIIQSQENPNFCMGVTQDSANSPVVLSLLQGIGGQLTQWLFDPISGYVQLAADPSLYLDVPGSVTQASQVIVANIVLGRQSQRWNWSGNPPFINNNAASNMVLDNSQGIVSAGNPILIFGQNGGSNQQWILLPVPALESALKKR